MKVIARIRSAFPEKFGIPRQSGLVEDLAAQIVFEPEYRVPEAVRGLEEFSHLWLLWEFSEAKRETWSPTVRPPRLGGNQRLGVFATRSPYRPNPIGLSCVKLDRIEIDPALGPVIHVKGADLMDATPIYDIKPYLPYADSHPEAVGGFAAEKPEEPTLAKALEDWLGPIADEIASAADLDDAALGQKLRNGFDLVESNTHALEKIMTQEMESEYANQLRGK